MTGFTQTPAPSQGLHTNASSSLLNSESEEGFSRKNSARALPNGAAQPGLITFSLEGNPIGDRGADAIAQLIMTKNDATKGLKMVNLNECSIGNVGFQKLKQALLNRGGLAREACLTHVGIKVERNLFDQ